MSTPGRTPLGTVGSVVKEVTVAVGRFLSAIFFPAMVSRQLCVCLVDGNRGAAVLCGGVVLSLLACKFVCVRMLLVAVLFIGFTGP